MLKPLIYIILAFFLIASSFIIFKDNRIVNQNDSLSIGEDSLPTFIMLPDSTLVPYDSINWDEPLDYVVFPYDDDTLFADTFLLKNNYQLIFFPAADGYQKNGRIHYGHYARLIGENIDSVIASSYGTEPAKYRLGYDSIDFDNCFALEYSGGGNYALYINLFDKKSGELIIAGHSGTYDIKNGLIFYLDDEAYELILYDVKQNKKIKVETPDDPCFGGTGHHAFYTITKVTPSAVYLRYDGCEESQTIKVKR